MDGIFTEHEFPDVLRIPAAVFGNDVYAGRNVACDIRWMRVERPRAAWRECEVLDVELDRMRLEAGIVQLVVVEAVRGDDAYLGVRRVLDRHVSLWLGLEQGRLVRPQ